MCYKKLYADKMSKIIGFIFSVLSFCSISQIEQFDPIINAICDSTSEIRSTGNELNSKEYNWLIRSMKNEHIENWGEALGNYTLDYHGGSLIFDQYFYHCLLRACPVFLESEKSNLFFYAIDTVNERRYNNVRKFVLDMELSDTVSVNKHHFLDLLPKEQKDSLRLNTAPYLKSIGQNCYLETKRQVNREKDTYIRITFIDYRTNQKYYELHFYYLNDDSLNADFVVFKSKEVLDNEEEIRKERMKNIPPPPMIENGEK